MEDVTLDHAKLHLEDLVARAARGEDVRITAPDGASVRLQPVGATTPASERVTDSMPPFTPLKAKRVPGSWEGKIPPPPDDFFDPMTEEELKLWYGDNS